MIIFLGTKYVNEFVNWDRVQTHICIPLNFFLAFSPLLCMSRIMYHLAKGRNNYKKETGKKF